MSFLYHLHLDGKRIASGEITGVDDGMGVAVGTFTAEEGCEIVRPLFDALSSNSADAMLWKQRDELRLELREKDGEAIPTEWIQVFDFRAEHGDEDAAELNAALSQPSDVQRILAALGNKHPKRTRATADRAG